MQPPSECPTTTAAPGAVLYHLELVPRLLACSLPAEQRDDRAGEPHRRLGHEAGLLGDLMALSDADRQLGHQRLYTVDSLRRSIEAAGYEIKAIEGLLIKPITTSQIKVLELSAPVLQAMLKVGIRYPELSAGILIQACAAG